MGDLLFEILLNARSGLASERSTSGPIRSINDKSSLFRQYPTNCGAVNIDHVCFANEAHLELRREAQRQVNLRFRMRPNSPRCTCARRLDQSYKLNAFRMPQRRDKFGRLRSLLHRQSAPVAMRQRAFDCETACDDRVLHGVLYGLQAR